MAKGRTGNYTPVTVLLPTDVVEKIEAMGAASGGIARAQILRDIAGDYITLFGMTPALLEMFDAAAAERGQTRYELVRRLIEETALEHYKKQPSPKSTGRGR